MTCKTCEELLSLYESAVARYSNAVKKIAGTLGDDFTRAFNEAQRLKTASQDASENLMMHWRRSHGNLASGIDDRT